MVSAGQAFEAVAQHHHESKVKVGDVGQIFAEHYNLYHEEKPRGDAAMVSALLFEEACRSSMSTERALVNLSSSHLTSSHVQKLSVLPLRAQGCRLDPPSLSYCGRRSGLPPPHAPYV